MLQVDRPHLRSWIDQGLAFHVPVEVVQHLVQMLEALPWGPARLDWETLNGRALNLESVDEDGQADWMAASRLGQCTHLIFLYAPNEPALACEVATAFRNLDVATFGHPGVNYIFGAVLSADGLKPMLDHFAEYDGGSHITVHE